MMRVKAVAILSHDNRIFTGPDYPSIIQQKPQFLACCTHGFILEDDTFVTREQAAFHAMEVGQLQCFSHRLSPGELDLDRSFQVIHIGDEEENAVL